LTKFNIPSGIFGSTSVVLLRKPPALEELSAGFLLKILWVVLEVILKVVFEVVYIIVVVILFFGRHFV